MMSLKDTLRIMVVDDMSTSRALVMQALDELGIRHVDHRPDPNSALRSLVAAPVHLVLSDFNMPGMDGLQLLEALRQNKSTRGIGFILVTGTADKTLIERGRKLGMNNYLRKQFTTPSLKACIQAVTGPF
jgi:two-component system chemotaxis response regulator CheY